MSDLERLIEQAAARGLLVNNLFQLDSGLWQANLRCASGAFEWGRGASAPEALASALAAAAGALSEPFYEPPAQSAKTAEELGL